MPVAVASALLEGLLIGALLLAPMAARAGDPAPEEKPRKLRTRQVLLSMDQAPRREEPFRSRFEVSKKRGLVYSQQLRLGDQKVGLKVYGPVVKKRPGMGIELEGLAIGDHSVGIKAYGSTKRQGFKVEVKF
jgi:hypothetical protein